MDISNQIDTGRLCFHVTSSSLLPVSDAIITISSSSSFDDSSVTVVSDINGNTDYVVLDSPPISYSMTPENNQPYSLCNAKISVYGYNDQIISGIQIYPGVDITQEILLSPSSPYDGSYNPIVIDAHTLWEYYPPKIAEPDVKPVIESNEIVLSSVVIPETIVVHDGVPTDTTAKNYYIPYADYIKNVACCEIYSTWPDATIRANVLAIMSFTLNRVYTEWYRNKGYGFTITSSTAFDHKWIYGKAISENISRIVDEMLTSYISRPGVKQPILTQYCDGKRVSCPNWMTQWGSKALGDDGLTAAEILRYYYGNDIYINNAKIVSGIPSSYPGYVLEIGSSGKDVLTIQEELATISKAYPAIPILKADGIYGSKTAASVKLFQQIFKLPETGIVDYRTWYKISQLYVAVSKIAENV